MNALLTREGLLDRIAIGVSGLCLVHCLTSAILLTVLASAGALLDPRIHEFGMGLALVLGVVALGRGIVSHGYMMPAAIGALGLGVMAGSLQLPHSGAEIVYSMLGVAILALGHDLNRRATN